jgi:outer membrane protein insertion porin family/translocation and assembly module TamA
VLDNALAFLAASVLAIALACGCASVAPGQEAIDAVSVRGTKAIAESDVEDKLATEESPRFLGVFGGVVYDYEIFNAATLQRDLARVERYYRSRGYYSAHARAGRVIPGMDRHVRVQIVVEEGLPTVNGDLVIEGLDTLAPGLQATVRIAARAALSKGAPFEEEKGNKCEGDARKALTDIGYAYATVKRETYVDIVHHVANTTLSITPGDTATFGPITIQGLDPDGAGPRAQEIPEAPLRRAIDIVPGEPFSTALIDTATTALLDLQVFAAVTVVPDLSHPETRVVPVTVHVEPSKLRQVRLGGGIEFDEIKTELHLIAGWENHNFLGGLRDFSVNFQPGVVFYPTRINNIVAPDQLFPEEKLRVELKQPGFIEAHTEGFIRPEFNVFPLLVETNPKPADPVVGYRELKGAIGVNRTFFKKLYVNLSYDGQVEDPFSYKDPLDADLSTLVILYPELIAHLDFRDDRDHPHSGIYLANDLQVAGGIFGGGPRDVRVQPEVRTYVPIGPKVTFASRASMGFLLASNYGNVVQEQLNDAVTIANRQARVSDIETVFFRGFFSGGPTSNRGFPLRGVAPHGVVPFLNPATASSQAATSCDPQALPTKNGVPVYPDPTACSIPIGGFTLWEFSNEVRFQVKGPISGATFCDMGDVSPRQLGQPQAIRLDHLHLSCGVGGRYDTPVGPLRFDVGYRIQPLQVLGYANEMAAFTADPSNGSQPLLAGIPLAIAIGIGEAY